MTTSPKPKRRWLPYVLLLGAVVLAGLGLRPSPAPVETARVTTGALRATVSEEGKTRIKQRYLVSAPVAGQLRRIPFKAGAEVQLGETVLAVRCYRAVHNVSLADAHAAILGRPKKRGLPAIFFVAVLLMIIAFAASRR